MTETAARLVQARAQAERLRADLAEELAGIIEVQGADPPDDEHDVEGSSVGFERARVTALLASADLHVAELSAATERLEAGDYGRCEVCDAPIGDERLAALPSTRRCVVCAAAASTRATTLLTVRTATPGTTCAPRAAGAR